ncbi:MAG: SRPBCC family protein [Actinomycetota bacterium]|nr:SRPBCC family protein [Actinomycetota bacterium]
MFEGTHAGGPLAPELNGPSRRALIMAGGGLKVAFQAGVLQVWLDEARDGGERLEFMHADGASGGVFNLAMWCQGMSGHRIAENWRRTSPVQCGLSVNWRGWLRGESILTMRKFRTRVLHDTWGLDWQQIRTSSRSATFNLFDFSGQRLVTLPPSQMSEDLLIAATSLPGWYPPVTVRERTYIDGVFVTDANLEAAIAAGANELWVVWTVSTAGRWRNGPVAEYFQVIEACANGALQRDLDRIAQSNRAHAEGRPAQYPHPVRVVPLVQEVPLHYLLVFTRRSMADAVDLGVRRARQWCRERGLDVCPEPGPATAGDLAAVAKGLNFRERMVGPVAFGCSDALVAAQLGDARGDEMTLRLRVEIDDLDAFFVDRQHRTVVSGYVDCGILGGVLPIERGSLMLLPETGPGRATTMEYRLDFADRTGRELTLIGIKTVRNDRGLDLWRDTTTLNIQLFLRQQDRNGTRAEDIQTPVLSGQLRLSPLSFLHQLTTFHATANTLLGRVRAVLAFDIFFLRRLAEIYLRSRDAVRALARPAAGRRAYRAPRGNGSMVPELTGWPAGEHPDNAAVFAHNERIIPAPPERVWELIVAVQDWSKFYANARFVALGDPAQEHLRPGSVFRWVTFGVPITSEVDSCEPPVRIGWRWWGRGPRGYDLAHGYHGWLLEPHERGTRVVTEETQCGFGPVLLRPILQWLLPLGHDYWLRQLARRASRPPQPTGVGKAEALT